jgi:acyl-CoA reductase-like NAD-dependent aldehyde dehydrogenase
VQRIYVEEDVYDAFLERFIKATKKLKLGDPRDPKTDIGPMISAEAAQRVQEWVEDSVRQGARVLCGGKRHGLVVEPTIIVDAKPHMNVMCEEVFGPVATVSPVKDLSSAIAAVNESRYGLQAGVFTASLRTALTCIRSLRVGGVVVNGTSNYRLEHQPYGGTKQSGIGREGTAFAIEDMTELRMVVLQ